MQPSDIQRATEAAISTAVEAGLRADEAIILSNSNKVTFRLMPCDVVARVGDRAYGNAEFEIALAQQLAAAGSPVAGIDPRVAPRVYERDGLVMTLWTHFESLPASVAPADYAAALRTLHEGLRRIDLPTPHFTDRVAEARRLLSDPEMSPALADPDRRLLLETLDSASAAITGNGAPEQLLHGEPHPGNLINSKEGGVFIDLETCCRGPVEFDLAHVPEAVSDAYPGVDRDLLVECRRLVLAMVAAWRWDRRDDFPNGDQWGRILSDAIRNGPPWPTLDALVGP